MKISEGSLYIIYMSNNNSILKLDNNLKNLILEVSAISGYSQNVVREVFELMLYNWAVKIVDHPDEYAELEIPYIGKIGVKFAGDRILPTEELATDVDAYVELNDSFKKFIGDLHDEGHTDLVDLIEKKIESVVLVASAE